ncbi:MAG: response regulator transcription factor [Bacteroidetes bacterium]|nr:response regulator transcription factor [Bacteroidota bacterium]MBU1483599.1 response regulator transcription factor [Bacteroidota bacterium]MBU1760932.1 response regulator transcription factor [Bacteroidota bacterium]MBU2047239.1 response regulator transcription factor [Bacteroidota bacterium]MBU2268002.1 response regulator transcription factor [Bacteroidota bacterium]
MINIVIADDHTLFAKGLASILSEEQDFNIKGIFNDGRSMIDFVKNQEVDIAIIDLNMPRFDGRDTLANLNELEDFNLKRIIVSMYAEETLLNDCYDLGIDAYVLKDTEPDILKNIIREVYEGEYIINDNQISKPKKGNYFRDDFISKYRLSKREIEIINLIVEGHSNVKIAEMLFLSSFTIDTHRKNSLRKLGLKNIAELIKFAIEQNVKNQKGTL